MAWLLFNLRLAYSTELGASTAYDGHARATRDPAIAARIEAIRDEELQHRAVVGAMLDRFGVRPYGFLELLYTVIGTCVGFGCKLWGEWASAFGAAQFEFGGTADYGRCARAARAIGDVELEQVLLGIQQSEADHRVFFLALAAALWPPWRIDPANAQLEH